MARRLIFASVPAGTSPGRSGYCTVAKSPGLPERLTRDLERISAHEAGEGLAFTYRRFDYGAERFGVITRYVDAGPDYTGRASTLADHLVFTVAELQSLPSPADIARRFTAWTDRIPPEPILLPDPVALPLAGTPAALPAARWKALAGDAGKAALFCDDAGRARAGTFPEPTPAVALELIAEASLLLEDCGVDTPFDTRRGSTETGFLWKASPGVSASTLPDPGLAPRATLARSGVMAGARPTAGKSAASTIRIETAAPQSSRLPLIIGGTVTLVALCSGVAFLALRESSPPLPVVSETPRPSPSPTMIRQDSETLREALAAMARSDLPAAAELRIKLSREHPEEDVRAYPKLLYPLRERLIPETLARNARSLDEAMSIPSSEERAAIAAQLDRVEALGAELGAPARSDALAELARLRATLAAMKAVDEAFRPTRLVARATGKTEPGELASTTTFDLGEVPELSRLLANPDARITVSLTGSPDFTSRTEPFLTQAIPPRDFSAGKILALNHPQHRLLAELRFDARQRATLRLRRPENTPDTYAALTGDRPLGIELTDTTTGETCALRLVADKTPPVALSLPAGLLTLRDGAVGAPRWLTEAVSRVTATGAKHALSPAGYTGSLREHSGLVADRSVIEQALRHPDFAARAESTRALLRAGDTDALTRLAPWRLAVAIPGEETPFTLIRFERR